MERRRFGSTKREVAVIGQGTWYLESANRRSAVSALRRGLDLGMTHIDTAEMYGSGAAEEVVAEAIGGRRDEVFLVSKVLPPKCLSNRRDRGMRPLVARLRTDRLDCYLLHWRGSHPLEGTIAAFEQLKQAGKILAWGVSNFDVPDLEAVLKIAGEDKLVCNQVLYHLEERAIEHAVIPWCEKHGVAVVAYSPFGHSRFPGPRTAGGCVLKQIAAAKKASVRQVALRFLVRRPSLFAIPKSSSVEHCAENAGAGDLHLTEIEVARIDEAFPLSQAPGQLPML